MGHYLSLMRRTNGLAVWLILAVCPLQAQVRLAGRVTNETNAPVAFLWLPAAGLPGSLGSDELAETLWPDVQRHQSDRMPSSDCARSFARPHNDGNWRCARNFWLPGIDCVGDLTLINLWMLVCTALLHEVRSRNSQTTKPG